MFQSLPQSESHLDKNELEQTEESRHASVAGKAWYGWVVAASATFAGVLAGDDLAALGQNLNGTERLIEKAGT
jgi:hypothetical protein